MNDRQLLRQFVEHNSQEAFAALMARYLSLVYSVCRRELDDAEMTEDATQTVFLILARKAPTLRRNVILSGWLFQTARFVAKNARTQAQRQAAYENKAYEQKAYEQKAAGKMDRQLGVEDTAWAEIEPLLNQSLAALGEVERECVLLRYFQQMSFVETGTALGLSEEAARKRLTRALEKMRRFFGKEGIIVPSIVLTALLSAQAVKAVPATCQASVAALTVNAFAGHLPASLAISHLYQLSEGALEAMKMKAMKIVQLKLAASVAATVVIGVTTYTVAKGITPATATARKTPVLHIAPKSGHVLVQTPGKALTASQIAARCREAYGALQSYQGTTLGTTEAVTGSPRTYHTSADIQFVRPGKIRVEGTDMSGRPFAYIADGASAYDKNLVTGDVWQKNQSVEMAIARVTGTAQSSAATIPALLLNLKLQDSLAPANILASEVREDAVDGKPCYLVTASLVTATTATSRSFWVDEKTFLLRRWHTDISATALGTAVESHIDQRFTNERLNEAISKSAFTLPPNP